MKQALVWMALSASVVAIGCGGDEKKPPVVPQAPATTQAATDKTSSGSLNVSDEISKACNLQANADPEKAPKFDFDSHVLDDADRAILAQIATCLTTGPLKGRTVQLIGRADPRGEQEYNMSLGANRAKTVSDYLSKLGVGAPQLKLTSRGELDATGTNEETWAKDRRVDIALVAN